MKINYKVRKFKKMNKGEYIRCYTKEMINSGITILKRSLELDKSYSKDKDCEFFYRMFEQHGNTWIVYEKGGDFGYISDHESEWATTEKYKEYKFGS